jgi:hypothetical protein
MPAHFPVLLYTEVASNSPTRNRTSNSATSGITTHLEAPRRPATTVNARPIGANKKSSARSNVSGSFQGENTLSGAIFEWNGATSFVSILLTLLANE